MFSWPRRVTWCCGQCCQLPETIRASIASLDIGDQAQFKLALDTADAIFQKTKDTPRQTISAVSSPAENVPPPPNDQPDGSLLEVPQST